MSAHSENQTQVLDDDDSLRLTFADENWSLKDSKLDSVPGTLMVDADEDASIDGYGWKAVDPTAEDGSVFASGFSEDGNIDTSVFPAGKVLDFYFWGQENGSAEKGWSNRATTANRVTIKDGKEYVPRSFGISLTGQTSGTLTAYRIGEYDETLFTQTGALKSVRLDTPEDLGTVLKTAAETAGGADVDADNPIGWVASRWLGYPTDPASEDVTSAFSPYAGQLQLFAQALAEDASGLTAEPVPLNGLDAPVDSPVTLPVSGPGLYLIVDSSGTSLPIIVGTKVFNEAMEDVVEDGMVDFADAGVKGKPRLGQAALKTTVTDIAKRIVNDAGMDGFDVGSEVEFEVALRVPDLSGLSNVSYDSYVFDVADEAASGLTLPADGSGVEVFVDALSPTEPQTLPPSSIAVSGDTLSVDGLKAVFAESSGSGVRNQDAVPVDSLIRIRYRAVLNASAVVSSPVEGESLKPNVNAVTLTRSYTDSATEGWTDNGDGTESKSATANVYSFTVDVVKLDKDDRSTTLGGVGFEVSRDGEPLRFEKVVDGVYRLAVSGEGGATQAVTTHTDGTLSLQGVEARELSFKETKAPSGYFRVSDFTVDIRPVWNEDATQVTKVTYATAGTNLAYVSKDGRQVTVLDPAWSLANLPYTGGMGILILLIVGGLMLVFAVRPYVLSKRAERDANLV
ncbi:SpaA isopeptide-forming pilin-related protein [Bifidobacterium crudilactis]|uniref:SpaA isopeptide-forming pilin-related protein n=1 Tax=Bifidobacterium crudilactis TaxID=327277 RepID=UPI0012EB3AC1|nr:SpaA isopeptide-forming pilin-related protein [Bifidobacterium crudilactis]